MYHCADFSVILVFFSFKRKCQKRYYNFFCDISNFNCVIEVVIFARNCFYSLYKIDNVLIEFRFILVCSFRRNYRCPNERPSFVNVRDFLLMSIAITFGVRHRSIYLLCDMLFEARGCQMQASEPPYIIRLRDKPSSTTR